MMFYVRTCSLFASFPYLPNSRFSSQDPFTRAISGTLADAVQVTPQGLKRKFGQARPYNSKRMKKTKPPPRQQTLVSLDNIIDGSAFPVLATNQGEPTCCLSRRCNEQVPEEVAALIRSEVPSWHTAPEVSRKQFVRERLMDAGGYRRNRLRVGAGTEWTEVCMQYFTKLTGISRTLVSSAAQPGAIGR